MKYLMIATVGVAVMSVLVVNRDNIFDTSLEVIRIDTATTTEPVAQEPEYPSEWQNAAQEAYEAVIRQKTLEAELEDVQGKIEALEVREVELQKELGTF